MIYGNNIFLTSQGMATMFTTLTLLFSIVFYVFFMKMALKLRKSIVKGLNDAISDLIGKFLDVKGVNPSGPKQPGMIKQAAGAVAAGAGMAAGAKLLNNDKPVPDMKSDTASGSEKPVEGDAGTEVAKSQNGPNDPSGNDGGSSETNTDSTQAIESSETNALTAQGDSDDSNNSNHEDADARVAQALGSSLDDSNNAKQVDTNNNLSAISDKLDAVQSEQQVDAARDSVRNNDSARGVATGDSAVKPDGDYPGVLHVSSLHDESPSDPFKTGDVAGAGAGAGATMSQGIAIRSPKGSQQTSKQSIKKVAMGAAMNALAGDNQFMQGMAGAMMADGMNGLTGNGQNGPEIVMTQSAYADSYNTSGVSANTPKLHAAGRLQQPQVSQKQMKIQSTNRSLDKVPAQKVLTTNIPSQGKVQDSTIVVKEAPSNPQTVKVIHEKHVVKAPSIPSQSLVTHSNVLVNGAKSPKTPMVKKLNNKKSDNEI